MQGVVKRLVSVGGRIEGYGTPVFYELKQILVVLDGLIGDDVVHRLLGEVIDLLHNGVGLLVILLALLVTSD